MVQMVWRHGDRAPSKFPYPNDKYNESYWPRGWNQLTNRGISKSVEFGIWLRQRYGDTLLSDFDSKKIFIQSTDSERAIETVQAVNAGLFPPNGSKIWETSYLRYWQPIAIHTNGISNLDPLLRPTKYPCPEYNRINKEEEDPVAQRINKNYSRLFAFLQNVTGIESIDYYNINDLYNIQRELEHNMPQPEWIEKIYNGSTIMDHIRKLKKVTRLQEFNTYQKSKFRAGYLLNNIIESMENSLNNETELNVYLYSAHEGTVTPLFYAMNITNDKLVPYNGCIIFELYDDSTVQIFYKDESLIAKPLSLTGCNTTCPLEDFSEILEDVRIRTIEELDELCQLQDTKTTQSSILTASDEEIQTILSE